MQSSLLLLAQAGGQAPAWTGFVPIILIFGIFYFLLLAPMRKRQKAHQKMIGELKKGDKVITSGGLLGEIAALEEKIVHLKLADNVRVRVTRNAIAGLESDPAAAEGSQP
jgi:preprotein translocase subunit YajC